MLNKLFLAIAKETNSHPPMLHKISEAIDEPCVRKATIKTFKNGNRLIDADILKAEHLKRSTAFVIGTLALGLVAGKIGENSIR